MFLEQQVNEYLGQKCVKKAQEELLPFLYATGLYGSIYIINYYNVPR